MKEKYSIEMPVDFIERLKAIYGDELNISGLISNSVYSLLKHCNEVFSSDQIKKIHSWDEFNVVEYNEIRRACLILHDNGAINSWMDITDVTRSHIRRDAERAGHIIRYNFIADTRGYDDLDEDGNIRDYGYPTPSFTAFGSKSSVKMDDHYHC